jgi:uncharacterized protein YbjT (DUF2867 family)/uncharacterized membrane protein YphA (DoxX/SURF4 family)
MRIFLTGASGFIGSHLARALLRDGHEIVAGIHRSGAFRDVPGVRPVAVDFARAKAVDDWLPLLSGVDTVVNAVGIIAERPGSRFDDLHRDAPIALFQAAARAGVRKIIQISALGADEAAVSRYHLSKKAADDALAGLNLEWLILQPSVVFGPGGQSTAVLSALAALPVIPVPGDGRQRIQPVHVDDLVAVVLRLLRPGAPSRLRLPVVGPEPLTLREALASLREWLGLGRPRFLPIPYPWLLAVAERARRVRALPFDAEALRMLQRGNVGDARSAQARLGFAPESLAAALRKRPATAAEYRHARLFFLLPALRWALGLLWVWSGLVSAFFYPAGDSFELLAATGITGAPAAWALYGAAALDIALGAAFLAGYRVVWTGAVQVLVMLTYTAVISLSLPEFWLHPFGPIAKNLPILAATLAVMAAERR